MGGSKLGNAKHSALPGFLFARTWTRRNQPRVENRNAPGVRIRDCPVLQTIRKG